MTCARRQAGKQRTVDQLLAGGGLPTSNQLLHHAQQLVQLVQRRGHAGAQRGLVAAGALLRTLQRVSAPCLRCLAACQRSRAQLCCSMMRRALPACACTVQADGLRQQMQRVSAGLRPCACAAGCASTPQARQGEVWTGRLEEGGDEGPT